MLKTYNSMTPAQKSYARPILIRRLKRKINEAIALFVTGTIGFTVCVILFLIINWYFN